MTTQTDHAQGNGAGAGPGPAGDLPAAPREGAARVLVAGHLCLDLTPAIGSGTEIAPGQLIEIGPLRVTLGGCVANTARVLSALGVPVRVAAAVADDELGETVRAQLTATGLPTDELAVVSRATTSYSLVLQPTGSDRAFWHHPGVNAAFDGSDLDLHHIGLLHVGYPPLLPALVADGGNALVALFQRARAAGITTSLDMSVVDRRSAMGEVDWDGFFRAVLPVTDVFTPSFDDLASALRLDDATFTDLAGQLVRRCLDAGTAVVTVSGGAEGIVLATGSADRLAAGGRVLSRLSTDWADRHLRRAAEPIPAVETTNGAGDAATAGLLYALGEALDPAMALGVAVETAAVAITGRIPEREAVVRAASRAVHPIRLRANQPADRFYRGGARIAEFRGVTPSGTHVPEDWVGSVTTVAGEELLGLTRLADGRLLVDAIAEDPLSWLGPEHLAAHGSDPLLLVKLLDAGQRLPVHAHPDDAWARSHLGRAHGKAEAWYILEPGEVFVGLRRAITGGRLLSLVTEQDVDSLIALLHRREVHRGDTVFVPPGTLHAIGAGTLLAEVQQPEDLSILLEWRDFDIDGAAAGHLGVGFPTALGAIDRRPLDPGDLDELITSRRTGPSILSPRADVYFRADQHEVAGAVELAPGFSILIVTDGHLDVETARGSMPAPRGSTILIPHAAGAASLTGEGSGLVFRPPDPAVGAPRG